LHGLIFLFFSDIVCDLWLQKFKQCQHWQLGMYVIF
jgi:hypothetical protein